MPPYRPLADRFWEKVDRRGDDECWEWTAARDPKGYGRINDGKQMRAAHRVSWALTHGSEPGDLLVCHTCDNPPCVNPAHLWLGTGSDNNRDMARKSRSVARVLPDGSRGPILPVEVVRAAVADYVAGRGTQAEIAARYGATRAAVSRWVTGSARQYDAGTTRVSRPLPPCGTEAAYGRHLRRGEVACAACKAAHAKRVRERNARRAA